MLDLHQIGEQRGADTSTAAFWIDDKLAEPHNLFTLMLEMRLGESD